MKRILLLVMIVWSNVLLGQQSFFIDSLFLLDISNIQSTEEKYKRSEINALEKDFGISIGTNITNSYQEDNDNSLSTRIYGRFNALSGGYYDNLMDAEKLFYELKIDSLKGNEHAVNYNYGIFYDYIISEYNKEKLNLIDTILRESKINQEYFTELYYNKLTDYNSIIELESIKGRFEIIKEAMTTFNSLSEQMLNKLDLPAIDFIKLINLLNLDTTRNEVQALEKEIIDIKYTKEKAASLSVSVGYDISRKQPYFGVAYSKSITFGNKRKQTAELLKLQNQFENNKIQLNKEISTLQLEYQYKQRQIIDQEYKIEKALESLRELEVKNEILGIKDGVEIKNISMEILLMRYEVIALRQQQSLVLLNIKRKVPTLELGKVIKRIHASKRINKFRGKRYVVINEKQELNTYQTLFISQNELHPVTPMKLKSIDNTFIVYPSDFNDRMEMEEYINAWLKEKGQLNLIIDNLESLKELEVKTIKKSHFDITSNLK